jgi:hypothetical protein
LDEAGETIFSKTLIVKTNESNRRILKLLCWTSTSKIYSPLVHEIYEIITFKNQSVFSGSILTMKFFTPKFIKIKNYLGIFTTFRSDFLTPKGRSFFSKNTSNLPFLAQEAQTKKIKKLHFDL